MKPLYLLALLPVLLVSSHKVESTYNQVHKIYTYHGQQWSRFQGLQWHRVVKADNVQTHVNIVSEGKLMELAAEYHHEPIRMEFRYYLGFAILYRNRKTGAFTCQIYMLRADDKATLAHEMFHCRGWVHPE